MLRFKQFINFYITEAKISHFAHLGLDPNNQEHKDLVDAYNTGVNRDPNIPKNPNQIKTFDHLKTSVAPHYAAIQQKRKEDQEDQEAFTNKEAELVHHDPNTGVKVFKVRSGKGCAAVGGDTKWCTADRETGNAAFKAYDPGKEYSYVIHTPEKGNLSKIGIIGVKPKQSITSGAGGNFQDKGNNTISDKDWENLRKKYDLDSVEALHGIRGLKNPDVEDMINTAPSMIKNPNTTTEDLDILAKHSNDPEAHKAILNHKNAGSTVLNNVALNSNDPEAHKAILNHKNAGSTALSNVALNSNDPEVHRAILNHPKVDEMHMEKISEKSSDPVIHKLLAKHKNSTKQTLDNVFHKSDDPEIHREIAKHDNAHPTTLDALAYRSDDRETLRSVLNHKNASDYALRRAFEKLSGASYNPYQLESKQGMYETIKNVLKK